MNTDRDLEFYEMGEKLAECAEVHEISARGRVSELFPYIGALAEGNSIRSVERMTGIHRDTIMRLCKRISGAGYRAWRARCEKT